jgi:hypothetical protein
MYSNNSDSARDAVCFFMDEEKGHEIGFVQFPQAIENITKNDVYSSSMIVVSEVSMAIKLHVLIKPVSDERRFQWNFYLLYAWR